MNVAAVIYDLDQKLLHFQLADARLNLLHKLLLVEISKETRRINRASLKFSGMDAEGSRERLRLYMTRYVGIVLSGVELEVVSGISECGRRIRELNAEDGFRIIRGPITDETEITLKTD